MGMTLPVAAATHNVTVNGSRFSPATLTGLRLQLRVAMPASNLLLVPRPTTRTTDGIMAA